ncbi:hypothetical protein HYS03_01395 [Candidatus Woesebacteria bacterium]|nr:hypothetical protein [Candidatus Woesebacteria bacterium]QQG47314.1 MAG: hypothetical protein HY044_04275 [Candidatus Woesebacteria bacterium]
MNKIRPLSFTIHFAQNDDHLKEVNNFYFNLFDKILKEIREKKRVDTIKKVN